MADGSCLYQRLHNLCISNNLPDPEIVSHKDDDPTKHVVLDLDGTRDRGNIVALRFNESNIDLTIF